MPTQFCLGHKGWLFSQISVTLFHDFADQDVVQSVVPDLSDRSHEEGWAGDRSLSLSSFSTLGEAWAQLKKSLADEAEVHLKFSSKVNGSFFLKDFCPEFVGLSLQWTLVGEINMYVVEI